MNTNQFQLLISFIICSGSALAGFAGIFYLRKRIERVWSLFGFWAVIIITGFFLGTPTAWHIALLSSWRNLENPEISGIGGSAYGLNYAHYPYTSLYFVIMWVLVMVSIAMAGVIIGPPKHRSIGGNFRFSLVQAIGRVRYLELMLFMLVVVQVSLFFYGIGFDRLWYSDLGRFELGANSGFMALLLGRLKFISFTLLFCGSTAGILLSISKWKWLLLLTALLSTIPFIVMSSRSLSVVFTALYLGLYLRQRMGVLRTVLLWGFVPFVVFVLLVPLRMRSLPYTGIRAFVESTALVSNELIITRGPLGVTGNVLFNLSNGYAIMSEAMDNGVHVYDQSPLPTMYYLLSFSPTISLIDGFSKNWLQYNPRINRYTPYSTIAELYFISPIIPCVFSIIVCMLLMVSLRFNSNRGTFGQLLSIAVLVLFALSLLQMQQYQTRTMMRVVYLWIFLSVISRYYRPRFLTANNPKVLK